MSDFIAGLITVFIVFVLFYGGMVINTLGINQKLDQCAKQHNVYACEYVAVPKKEGAE